MDRAGYALLALAGGGLIAAQAPINARLRTVLHAPVGSALISFVVGTLVLAVAALVAGQMGDTVSRLGGGPWWAYLGGICGAVFVFATLLASPRIGVTETFVAVVLGQVVLAALIDRFGWFGVKAIPLTWQRGLAIGLLVVSLVLIEGES
jgi:bacterial/archaeal transporter family-2 protein